MKPHRPAAPRAGNVWSIAAVALPVAGFMGMTDSDKSFLAFWGLVLVVAFFRWRHLRDHPDWKPRGDE